jgi:hypothetical protein
MMRAPLAMRVGSHGHEQRRASQLNPGAMPLKLAFTGTFRVLFAL